MSDAVVTLGWDNTAARAGAAEAVDIAENAKRATDEKLNGGLGEKLKGILGLEKGQGAIAGLFGGGTLLGALAVFKEFVDKYRDVATIGEKLNASPEAVQRLGSMFAAINIDLADAASQIANLQKALADPSSEEAVKAMTELKINMADFVRLQPDQQMKLLADAFVKAERSGVGLSGLYALMGKHAADVIPLLRRLADGVVDVSQKKVFSAGQVQDMAQTSEYLNKLIKDFKEFAGLTVFFTGKGIQWLFGQGDKGGVDAVRKKFDDIKKIVDAEVNALAARQAQSMHIIETQIEQHRDARNKSILETALKELQENEVLSKQLDKAKHDDAFEGKTPEEKRLLALRELVDANHDLMALESGGIFTEKEHLTAQLKLLETKKAFIVATKDAAEAAKKERQEQLQLAQRLEREGKQERDKKEAVAEFKMQLELEKEIAAHHWKRAEALQLALRLEQEIKRLKSIGVDDEREQMRLAMEKINAEARANGQRAPFDVNGKIHGGAAPMAPGGDLRRPFAGGIDAARFDGLDALKKLNARVDLGGGAEGGRVVPIGRGFDRGNAGPLAAQAQRNAVVAAPAPKKDNVGVERILEEILKESKRLNED